MWRVQDNDLGNNHDGTKSKFKFLGTHKSYEFSVTSNILIVEIRLHLLQLQDLKFLLVTKLLDSSLGLLKSLLSLGRSVPEWLSLLDFGQGHFVLVYINFRFNFFDLFTDFSESRTLKVMAVNWGTKAKFTCCSYSLNSFGFRVLFIKNAKFSVKIISISHDKKPSIPAIDPISRD